MIWLYPIGDSFSIFYAKPDLPDLIEVESLPEGDGILRMSEEGELYYEPSTAPMPEPPITEIPVETLEEKLVRMEEQLTIQQQQNLILLDVNMTIYEELLMMQERFANA